MSGVYENAAITIAADWSAGAEMGLYNSHSRSTAADATSPVFVVPCLDGQSNLVLAYSSESPRVKGSISQSNLATRGWSFQEGILSPRVLHFTKAQLYWECAHSFRSEDGFIDIATTYDEFKGALQHSVRNAASKHNIVGLWYLAIGEQYSRRRLSKQTDRLLAVAGTAQAVNSICSMQYYAGHWDHMLVRSMCWQTEGDQGKIPAYCAPSWSWASQLGAVSWGVSFDLSITEYAEALDVMVTTQSGVAFGLVTDAPITLRTSALGGRFCERSQPTKDNNATICLDTSDPFQDLGKDNVPPIYLSGAWLDHPDQVDVEIQVCLMAGFSQFPWLWFLLLAETKHESGQYVRVGCAQIGYLYTGREVPEYKQLLRLFLDTPKRTFVIV